MFIVLARLLFLDSPQVCVSEVSTCIYGGIRYVVLLFILMQADHLASFFRHFIMGLDATNVVLSGFIQC